MNGILDETYFKINLFATEINIGQNGPVNSIVKNLNIIDCANWPLADKQELIATKKLKFRCIDTSKVVFWNTNL